MAESSVDILNTKLEEAKAEAWHLEHDKTAAIEAEAAADKLVAEAKPKVKAIRDVARAVAEELKQRENAAKLAATISLNAAKKAVAAERVVAKLEAKLAKLEVIPRVRVQLEEARARAVPAGGSLGASAAQSTVRRLEARLAILEEEEAIRVKRRGWARARIARADALIERNAKGEQ